MALPSDMPPDVRTERRLGEIEYDVKEIRATLGIVIEMIRAVAEKVGANERMGELCDRVERIAARRRKPRKRVIR